MPAHIATIIHWNTPNTRMLRWHVELNCGHTRYEQYRGYGTVDYPVYGGVVQCWDQSPRPSYGCADCRFGRAFIPAEHYARHNRAMVNAELE